MNLLLLYESDLVEPKRFVVGGDRARHLEEVLRVEPGSNVRVGLLNGPVGTGRVVDIGENRIELECELESEPPPRPAIDLVLAIPRPKLLKKILPQIAALGIDRLVLLRTWRVQKPYLATKILSPSGYAPLLHEGLMQGRRTHEPRVTVEPLFKPFVEDRASAMFEDSLRLVAHPSASRALSSLSISGQRVALVVGPEGGLIAYEVELFQKAGFIPVTAGDFVLRVDTACVALLAQILLLRQI